MFGIVIGEVLFFLLLIGGLVVGALAASALNLSVLVGAWHGFLSYEWDASGLVLTGTMAALCLFSLWFFRRRIFEAFLLVPLDSVPGCNCVCVHTRSRWDCVWSCSMVV